MNFQRGLVLLSLVFFGSYAKDEASINSDIDILIELEK